MARQKEQEPVGAAVGIAIVALWFHIGLAVLAVLGAFTPDANVRTLSAFWALVGIAVVIGLQRRRPAAIVWGIVLSSLSYGIALGRNAGALSSALLILIPLIIAATKSPASERREPRAPRRAQRTAVWFPPAMDDPLLARLRPPRDWD